MCDGFNVGFGFLQISNDFGSQSNKICLAVLKKTTVPAGGNPIKETYKVWISFKFLDSGSLQFRLTCGIVMI